MVYFKIQKNLNLHGILEIFERIYHEVVKKGGQVQ